MERAIRNKYRAIIFDLDGTLIDSMPLHFKAFKETLKEHGVNMADATLRDFMGSSTKKILQDIKKIYPFEGKIQDVREERRYHYFKALGDKKILFPGVEDTIKKLRYKYRLAIATGSSRVTTRYSISKKFQSYFGFISTLNDVQNSKPAPDQLLLAARKIGVAPKYCLMVGDSTYDIIAAKRARMDSIGVLTGYTSKKELISAGAKVILNSVNEINSYLNEKVFLDRT
jgi:HAD superfamily hydrolase (TIGR01549 family)